MGVFEQMWEGQRQKPVQSGTGCGPVHMIMVKGQGATPTGQMGGTEIISKDGWLANIASEPTVRSREVMQRVAVSHSPPSANMFLRYRNPPAPSPVATRQ